jgi:hypothetical protein
VMDNSSHIKENKTERFYFDPIIHILLMSDFSIRDFSVLYLDDPGRKTNSHYYSIIFLTNKSCSY